MTARLLALACAAACLTGAGYGDALRDARSAAGARQMAGAVLHQGRVVWTGAAGNGAKAADVYSLASLSKTYVAALALKLAAAGKLSLDDPASHWLSGMIPPAAARVTVRELLDHTSGLPDYLDDPRVAAAMEDPFHRWHESELLRAVRAPRNRGSFAYSNTNYVLLGAILRRVANGPVARTLAARILRPLGLRSTSLVRTRQLSRRVAGHRRLPNDVWGELWTDGGIVASAADVGRFMDALVVRGRVLPAAAREELLASADDAEYGLGIYAAQIRGETYYGHDGSYGGWDAYAVSSPATGMTFVAVSRGGKAAGPSRAVAALADAALTQPPGG